MKRTNNVGFTLIELLVVVLIVGILAAVALPQYTRAVEKSRTAEAMTLLGDIMTAQRIYKLSNSGCGALSALDIDVPEDTTNFHIEMDADNCKATAFRDGTTTANSKYSIEFTLDPTVVGGIKRECKNGTDTSICAAISNSKEWANTAVTPATSAS